jgi:hypothetical protein
MIFPDLQILEEVDNKNKTGDYKKLLKCQLSWKEMDFIKIDNHKKWTLSYRTDGFNDLEKEELRKILNECVWSEYNYPIKWESFYDKFSTILIPEPYYKEIKHFENLALTEWNRIRPFNNNLRENCLKVASESINLYFYLLSDATYIYNKELYSDYLDILLIETLWLFRFWKHQTGGFLVLKRSLSHFNNEEYLQKIKDILLKDLSENMRYDIIFGHLQDFMDMNNYFDKLKYKIKERIRNNNIENILNEKR